MKNGIIWKTALFAGCLTLANVAAGQTTAFSYQGRLSDAGIPANGSYNLSFAAYDAVTDGNLISPIVTNSAVAVSNGVFVTTVDLGGGIFTGSDLWLEISVSTNGSGTFTTILPRQVVTPVPFALFAQTAGTANMANTLASSTVSVSQLNTLDAPASGQVLGYNGAQLVWEDPVVGGASGGWSLSGNLGTTAGVNFLGTLDNQPLILKAGGVRALRLEPDATSSGAPNLIGGSPANYVPSGVVGATIAGGGAVNYSNTVTAAFAMIGGGVKNIAGGQEAFVGGGFQNTASGYISTVAGGAYNIANGSEAVVGGGAYNSATTYSFVGGGYANTASAVGSAIAGGGYDGSTYLANSAAGQASFIGGGLGNSTTANGYAAAISGGSQNTASGGTAFVGGGVGNTASGNDQVSDLEFFLGNPFYFFFSGSSTVSGGQGNTASASCATVPGGAFNTAAGDFSFAGGYHASAQHNGSFVWADNSSSTAFASTANNQFLIRAAGGVAIGASPPPPGGLIVSSGGLAVAGASSPNYPNTKGVYIEKEDYGTGGSYGAVYAYNYNNPGPHAMSLCLNSPGGFVGIGTTTPGYTLDVNGTTRTHSIIITGGADVAEPFKTGGAELPKGSVVVIDKEHPGELKLSSRAYDKTVAGIVSGANGIYPGIALQQEGAIEGGQNVALSGRVYVQADASNGAIEPGDLLTTSPMPGHAMKATDPARAQGAIIGKAMTALAEGRGTVLVLVTLQ